MILKTLAISFLFTLIISVVNPLPAGRYNFSLPPLNSDGDEKIFKTSVEMMDDLIISIYNELESSLNSSEISKPNFPVFRKALIGYYNLLEDGALDNKNLLTVIDFSLSSDQKRLWVINLAEKRVLFNDLVAHGRNSGNVMAESFSNVNESHMSSQGFYTTGVTYFGKHGLSLRLNGMEKDINDNAFDRAIVMHGADYVSEEFIKTYGRLGRSYGCPSVSQEISKEVINTIKDKSCLFIYSPVLQYDKISKLLNPTKALDYLSAQNFSL